MLIEAIRFKPIYEVYMLNKICIKLRRKNSKKIRGIISIVAAIIMYFTPDSIDSIIEGLLLLLGIDEFLVIEKRRKGE